MIRDREDLPSSDGERELPVSPRGLCTLKGTLDISVPLPLRFVNQRGPDCSPYDPCGSSQVTSEE